MNRIGILLAVLMTALAFSPAVDASSYHRRSTGVFVSAGVTYCDDQNLVGSDVGGSCGPAVDERFTGLQIHDDLFPNQVYNFHVCQDWNGDGICGGLDEPSIRACGNFASAEQSRVHFQPGVAIRTFMLAPDPVCAHASVSTSCWHWYYYG